MIPTAFQPGSVHTRAVSLRPSPSRGLVQCGNEELAWKREIVGIHTTRCAHSTECLLLISIRILVQSAILFLYSHAYLFNEIFTVIIVVLILEVDSLLVDILVSSVGIVVDDVQYFVLAGMDQLRVPDPRGSLNRLLRANIASLAIIRHKGLAFILVVLVGVIARVIYLRLAVLVDTIDVFAVL